MIQVPGWNLVNESGVWKLHQSWKVKTFVKGMEFLRLVGDVAEAEGTVPSTYLVYVRHILDVKKVLSPYSENPELNAIIHPCIFFQSEVYTILVIFLVSFKFGSLYCCKKTLLWFSIV